MELGTKVFLFFQSFKIWIQTTDHNKINMETSC